MKKKSKQPSNAPSRYVGANNTVSQSESQSGRNITKGAMKKC